MNSSYEFKVVAQAGATEDVQLDSDESTATTSIKIEPQITSATYVANTGVLTITGTNLPTDNIDNGWNFAYLKIEGTSGSQALNTNNAHGDTAGSAPSATSLTITFKNTHKNNVDRRLSANGLNNGASTPKVYNLKADAGAFIKSPTTTDATNPITVSKIPVISSAAYDASSGALVITGTDLPTAVAEWDLTKLKITGTGGDYTVTTTDTAGSNATATSFTITFTGIAKTNIEVKLSKNGTTDGASPTPVTYNLAAAEGAFQKTMKAKDESGNGITVSNK
ncbi:MAG: hypothetical protein AAGA31_09815 [Bacteroidota bacterium]